MTSGFADYVDEQLERWTLQLGGEDLTPIDFIRNAAHQGYICDPGTCASYSGINYILLGLVLVDITGVFSWQDLDQLAVIPNDLWLSGRYKHTSFMKAGRCKDFPKIAHQFAAETWHTHEGLMVYNDLAYNSCLNGWTMGNIATTAEDLATFFYDIFSPDGTGFVEAETLAKMKKYKRLQDKWCLGPEGYGSCKYGLGFLWDQVGQDVWPLLDPKTGLDSVRIQGHSGADWGSGCSPCGYNPTYKFGICIAYTSTYGMNCSGDWRTNDDAIYEATCEVYDAVLQVVGGPRLNCSRGSHPGLQVPQGPPLNLKCKWIRNHFQRKHPRPTPKPIVLAPGEDENSSYTYYYYSSYDMFETTWRLVKAGNGLPALNCSWEKLTGSAEVAHCSLANPVLRGIHENFLLILGMLVLGLLCRTHAGKHEWMQFMHGFHVQPPPLAQCTSPGSARAGSKQLPTDEHLRDPHTLE